MTMRDEINLTNEQIEARFDDEGYGLTVDDLSFTRETVADFAKARGSWHNAGALIDADDGKLVVRGCQAVKGQPRRDLIVVDFGSVRAVYLG